MSLLLTQSGHPNRLNQCPLEAGNKPLPRQCGNRPQQSNIDGNGCAGIGDRFSGEFRFLYLKIAR